MKTCTACNLPMPLNEFYRLKSGKHGRMAICKHCHCKAVKENYRAKIVVLREQIREQWRIRMRAYRARLAA